MARIVVMAQEFDRLYMETLRENLERHGVTEAKVMPTIGAVFGQFSGDIKTLRKLENVEDARYEDGSKGPALKL